MHDTSQFFFNRYNVNIEVRDSSGNLYFTLQDKHARFMFRCDASYLRDLKTKVYIIYMYIFLYNIIYKLSKTKDNFELCMLLIVRKMEVHCSTNTLIHAKIVHSHL